MSLLKRVVAEKRRLVLPVAVVFAANVVVFAAAVLPLQRKVDTAAARAARAAEMRGEAQARYRAAQAVVTGKQRADEELRKFYTDVLPADWTAARRITYLGLVRLAAQDGLKPARSGAAEPDQERDSVLSRLQMTMQLQGDYRQIRRFIYDLEKAPEFVVIENVALAPAQDAGAPLMLTVDVSTYYWTGTDAR